MNLLSVRREIGEFKKRYKWMALVVVLTFAVLFGRMIQLQLVEYDYYAQIARENITRTEMLPATRGIIRDTEGRPIATNRASFDVYLTPQYLRDRDVEQIAELMGLDTEARRAFRARLDGVPARRRAHQIKVFSDIGRDQLAALETHEQDLCARTGGRGTPMRLPCIDVVVEPVRTYPFGTLAAHSIGYLNEAFTARPPARDGPAAQRAWEENHAALERAGYHVGDRLGRTGIERAWEGYLRGHRGYRRVWVDAHGHEVETAAPGDALPMRREPVPGRDLTLTLDMELMRIVERAFRGYPSGGAVVVDVHTGAVRALFSKPSYDLSLFSRGLSGPDYAALTNDPFHPLRDKTIYEIFPPGSVFKPFAALAALEDELIDPTATVNCTQTTVIGGTPFGCTSAHGDVDLREALVESCNIYFYQLGQQAGVDRLARVAGDFGLGRRTGIGINSEAAGLVPTRLFYEQRRLRSTVGHLVAIGQGDTRVTLIQLAMAYAAIANGGTLYTPQLVERVTGPDGTVVEEFEPRVRRRVSVRQAHLARVVEALYGVVNEASGTAYGARIAGGVPIAGKTGTAQLSQRIRPGEAPTGRAGERPHAWFAGFAPAGAPELAIVVFIEHGGAGGQHAAPIGVRILQEYLGGRTAAGRTDATLTRTH